MGCRTLEHSGPAKLLLVLFSALAALVLALPAPASAYLYWNVGSGIARADLNGGGVDESFVYGLNEDAGTGVAVNSQYIYFGSGRGLVGRASIDGGDADQDLFRIPQPAPETRNEHIPMHAVCLAVEGDYIYWSSGEAPPMSDGSARGAIGRASIDGGDVEPDFIKTEAPAFSIKIYAGHIYWRTEHAIARANLDGGSVEQSFIPTGNTIIGGIAVASGHIYWSSLWGHSIGRANVDGSDLDPHFISGLAYPYAVAVGGGHIYWDAEKPLEEKPTNAGPIWIGRANLDGSDVQQSLIKITTSTSNLAVDALGPGARSRTRHTKSKHKHRRD